MQAHDDGYAHYKMRSHVHILQDLLRCRTDKSRIALQRQGRNQSCGPIGVPCGLLSLTGRRNDMQMAEIKKLVNNVEHTIHRTAMVCEQDRSAPQELRQVLGQLDQQSTHGKEIIRDTHDESRVREYIEELESLGDTAKRACESGKVSPELRNAVMQAHDELSSLKHQLH
jgi:hypothetical protein